MARFNEILVGRYNRFLQKLLSMKGGPPSPQLASEIVASFPFFSGRENRYLEAWQTFAASVTSGASLGNFSAVRIRNPAGSNIVAILERIEVFTATVSTLTMIYNSTAAALLNEALGITSLGLDPRGITNGTAIISSSANAGAIAGQSMDSVVLAANVPFNYIITDIHELPLLPGSQYSFTIATSNLAVTVNFLWRERFLEDSERT